MTSSASEPLHAANDQNPKTASSRARSILGACSGNLVEWYDFFIYAYTSIYFAAAFFPKGDQTTQLLAAAGVFAVGFFMRPLGGWLFGWTDEIRDMDGVHQLREQIGARNAGVKLATVKIKAENPPRVLPPRDGSYIKNRFRAALGYQPI